MSKFYSPEAYEEMVNGYVANGFSRGAAEEMVAAEEAIAMQEYDDWTDELENGDYYNDEVEF
jgi:hypothetical protein